MILIVFSHPYIQRSHANKAILNNIAQKQPVVIDNLYEKYPDFHIDIAQEQSLLERADLIIFQFPMYCYNVPALFKQWQEVVLTKQFALGDKAHTRALQGKMAMAVVTAGHEHRAYQKDGHNNYPLEDFIRPLELMSLHCGMNYHSPLALHQAHKATTEELSEFSHLYHQRIEQLLEQLPDNE